MSPLRWGLIPHWAKDAKQGARLINARRETLAQKPAFRDAYRRRRCLIPANGFYEWTKLANGGRQPRYISRKDEAPMALAGLWERWKDPASPPDHPAVDTCTLITTPAEGPLVAIHPRAPALIPKDAWEPWLDRNISDAELLQAMLRHPRDLVIVPVSSRVNNPVFDDPDCRKKLVTVT